MADDLTKISTIEDLMGEEEEDMTNKWVWYPSAKDCWIQVQIISMLYDESTPDQSKEYLIDSPDSPGTFKKIPVNSVYRVDPTHVMDLDNICLMNDMHEAPLVDLLRRRFFLKKIYTYTGDILISLNPYESIPGLYESPLEHFSLSSNSSVETALLGRTDKNPAPHVFQIANSALCSLAKEHVHGIDADQLTETDNLEATQTEFQAVKYNNQSIIISGESGAGKTENSKHVLNFLIAANNFLCCKSHQKQDANYVDTFAEHLKQILVQSSVVLEAFGNAKTVRNDNSSRFGKYIKLLYVPTKDNEKEATYPKLVSALTETFLLEKSRLTNVGKDERCYHIFYQLLAGFKDAEQLEKLGLNRPIEDFKMLVEGGVGINGHEDVVEYQNTVEALSQLQCSPSEVNEIIKLLASILHLGNVVLNDGVETSEGSGSEMVKVSCPTMPIEALAEMLGLERTMFNLSLTMQQLLISNRSSLKVKILSTAEVANNISALIKYIYSHVFEWLVRKINFSHHSHLKDANASSMQFIGILDIFGFEILQSNSFEQLCINFTNERLQQQFNHHVFITEQEMYKSEGLEWSSLSFRDNQNVIDLIANMKKPNLGLLILLEEQGMLNRKPDDLQLLAAFNQIHDLNTKDPRAKIDPNNPPIYSKAKFGKDSFTIKHFAGEVTYLVEGFLAKNNDSLQSDLLKLLQTTKSPFFRNVLKFADCNEEQIGFIPSLPIATPPPVAIDATIAVVPEPVVGKPMGTANKKMASAVSVSSQFRQQLDILMNTLNSTSPHYIKCIKSNPKKTPDLFEASLVVQQLRYSGIFEVVRIRREGYPLRMTFFDFYREYEVLAKGKSRIEFPDPLTCSFEDAKRCSTVLATTNLIKGQYQLGHSLIFLRDNGKQIMIEAIKNFFFKKVSKLQALARSRNIYKWYWSLRKNVIIVQASIRSFVYRKRYLKVIQAAHRIKYFYISRNLRVTFKAHFQEVLHKRKIRRVTVVQKIYRGRCARKWFKQMFAEYLRKRNAAVVKIQSLMRGHLRRIWFKDILLHMAATKIQTTVRARLQQMKYAQTIAATIAIQTVYRMAMQRVWYLDMRYYITVIQCYVRKYINQKRFQKIRKSVVKIQTQVRRFQATNQVMYVCTCVVWMQNWFRMLLAKKRYLKMVRKAVVIQAYVRRHLAGLFFYKKYISICTCQRLIRGYFARRSYRMHCAAIVAIQSMGRMIIARRFYQDFQFSILVMQGLIRGYLVRRHFQAQLKRVLKMQTLIRKYLAISMRSKQMKAVIKLQSFGRMINSKRNYDDAQFAVITIQTSARKFLGRKFFLHIRQQTCKIEAWCRRFLAIKYKERAMKSIVKLQSFGRMINAQRSYTDMYISIVMIQSTWRGKDCRNKYHHARAQIIKIQSVCRMYQQMQIYYQHLAAAIAIQSLTRKMIAMNHFQTVIVSILSIQANVRGFLARQNVTRQVMALLKLQSFSRMAPQRQRFRKVKYSASCISATYRMWVLAKALKKMKKSAKLLQRALRAFLRNVSLKHRIDNLHNMCLGIQDTNNSHSPARKTGDGEVVKPSPNTALALLSHLRKYPEDKNIRLRSYDFSTLFFSVLRGNQENMINALAPKAYEILGIDKYSRNSAHYLAMYPSFSCFNVLGNFLNETKLQHVVHNMGAIDDDDDDDNDAENENVNQLKQALNMSVGTSTLKQGWLKKKRGGMYWQKRWFVLTEDYIIYYKNPQSISNPKFAIPLMGCTIQRGTGTKDPVIEFNAPNMGDKKTIFGSSTKKCMMFMTETEKELQEWLMPLRAVAGVNTLRTSSPVNYVHTELRSLWVAAVDKNLETALHLLVRYHCIRYNLVSHENKNGSLAAQEESKRLRRTVGGMIRHRRRSSAATSSPTPNSQVEDVKAANNEVYKIVDNHINYSCEEAIKVLCWLVEYGCPINAQNNQGETAMHIALINRADPRIVRALLIKGSDFKLLKDDSGLTALDLVASQPDLKSNYYEFFSNGSLTAKVGGSTTTSSTQQLNKQSQERNFQATGKLTGYTYLSIYFGEQLFANAKSVNDKCILGISAYNANKQLIELAKEIRNPTVIDPTKPNSESQGDRRLSATTSPRNSQVEDATSIYWGSVWHMQTPLDNIDTGSFVAIEYRSVATTPGATATTVIATFPLDIESIDSGLQTVQLLPSADASKGNPIFANGDKSTVQIEIVLNKRNREIDVKSLYST